MQEIQGYDTSIVKIINLKFMPPVSVVVPIYVKDKCCSRKSGHYTDSAQLGNVIRQQFGILTYRLSKLCNIDAMAESSYLLDVMCSPNSSVYFSVDTNLKGKTADFLVDEIYSNVTNGNFYNLQQRLKEKNRKI